MRTAETGTQSWFSYLRSWVKKIEISDDVVIDQVLQGNTQKFEILVARYQECVYRFVLKYVHNPVISEDLAQDAFVVAYQKLHTFRQQSTFRSWIFGIALNLSRNYLRRAPENKYHFIPEDTLYSLENKDKTPDQQWDTDNKLLMLKQSLHLLPEDLREVITLVSLQGCSYQETAQMLNLPIGTVKSKLFRAKDELRYLMQRWK